MKKWFDLLDTFGFVLVNGVGKTLEATEELALKMSYVRTTIYGGMWELRPDMAMDDTAYTRMELRPHTDCCYLADPPGYCPLPLNLYSIQICHILEHNGTGGETTIVDGFKVVQQLRERYPEAFEFFRTTPVPFQYLDGDHSLYQMRTVFDVDQSMEATRFGYKNDDRAPILLPSEKVIGFSTPLNTGSCPSFTSHSGTY